MATSALSGRLGTYYVLCLSPSRLIADQNQSHMGRSHPAMVRDRGMAPAIGNGS